jgi:hypothetical protein
MQNIANVTSKAVPARTLVADESTLYSALQCMCQQVYIYYPFSDDGEMSTYEWLLPIGSTDPTYPYLSTITDRSGLSYPNGAGDCLNPIMQPSCYSFLPTYCGPACTFCADLSTTSCARFKAPPVRSPYSCCAAHPSH